MHTTPKEVCVPLTVVSESQGAGTDGTSLIAEMMCVASTEASRCNKNTQGHHFGKLNRSHAHVRGL